jgi:hypothetical protein
MTTPTIDTLSRKDPLAFGISYIDLLENRQWTLENRRWSVEPYGMLNPFNIEKDPTGEPRKMAITKSTQAGISTMAIVKALHFMTYWDVRIGYMLPRLKDISDFTTTRLNPTLAASDFLRSRTHQFPDNVSTKAIANSYLFMMEGSVEPRSMPMDALYLDEVDLCNPDHVGTAVNRLDASNWKIITYLSTPTLPNTGIDAAFQNSDQREWVVSCSHCDHRQIMDWDRHLRLRGPSSDPEMVWFACEKCEGILTVQDMQNGAWIPQLPSKTKDLVGYHISQIYTTPAQQLYSYYRDPNQTIAEFYRKRLGRPYTMAGGSLDRNDFLINCFIEPYSMEMMHDGESTYYMGCDQGNQLQLVIAKIPKGKSNPRIVYIELVPFEKGFDRVAELMQVFKIKRAVIDGDPNRHPVRKLQEQFPGRVLMADYIEQTDRFTLKKNDRKVDVHVTINRTDNFDYMVDRIREGFISLPGNPPNLPPQVEVYIDQLMSIKRDIEKRKTPSGEIEVGIWRKMRADHLAHATGYLLIALGASQKRRFRIGKFSS